VSDADRAGRKAFGHRRRQAPALGDPSDTTQPPRAPAADRRELTMASEAKRGILRIVPNYVRLLATLALGLVLLPVVVSWLGLEAFGLISLVASTGGIAGIFRELTNQSMVRELGAAYHSADAGEFERVYSSAYVVSIGSMLLTALAFLGLFLVMPLLNVPEEWVGAAQWIVAAQGTYSCLLVLLMPAFSMYLVREQFGWYNLWVLLGRSSYLTSALVLSRGFGLTEVTTALKGYGVMSAGLLTTTLLTAVCLVVLPNRRFVPSPGLITREAVRRVTHTFGWNGTIHVALSMHERLASLLMNLAFGVFGNAVFEIAYRLVSYVRMTTAGVTLGLDAVSARISSGTRDDAVRTLVHHSTRVHSFVALPAGLAMFLLAEPLLRLWIGSRVEDPEATIPPAVVLVRILAFALTARSIADGWMYILYGAGHVRRYAPLVLLGGITSPIVGAILLFVLPTGIRFDAPALGFATVYTIVHFLLLPAIGARCLETRYADLFTPITRPAIVTALCAPVLIVPFGFIEAVSLPNIVAVAAVFGVLYAALSWIIVLSAEERKRFGAAFRRHLPLAAR
jgi:O-antigen/teichoic acid export membrane protein